MSSGVLLRLRLNALSLRTPRLLRSALRHHRSGLPLRPNIARNRRRNPTPALKSGLIRRTSTGFEAYRAGTRIVPARITLRTDACVNPQSVVCLSRRCKWSVRHIFEPTLWVAGLRYTRFSDFHSPLASPHVEADPQ